MWSMLRSHGGSHIVLRLQEEMSLLKMDLQHLQCLMHWGLQCLRVVKMLLLFPLLLTQRKYYLNLSLQKKFPSLLLK